jgi:peptidase E
MPLYAYNMITNMTRQIIALGGGGFLEEPDNPALDLYVLQQAAKPNPSVCFLPTGSPAPDSAVVAFYSAYSRYNCKPSHLSLFRRTPDLPALLLSQDVIYVGGGNSKSMLAVWREWGIPELLHTAWNNGIVLAGVCGGALCWFEQGVTDSFANGMTVLPALGFISGSCCPHYDGEADRRPAYHGFVQRGEMQAGFALDIGAAIHFVDEEIHAVVASRPEAKAYRVELTDDGEVREEALQVRSLRNLPTEKVAE